MSSAIKPPRCIAAFSALHSNKDLAAWEGDKSKNITNYDVIYMEVPKGKAEKCFESYFGINPCPDYDNNPKPYYSLEEYDNLDIATSYARNVKYDPETWEIVDDPETQSLHTYLKNSNILFVSYQEQKFETAKKIISKMNEKSYDGETITCL
jgi:hypothetical protein